MTDTKAVLKTVLWIVLGALSIAIVLVIVLPLFFRNKNTQQSPIKDIIEKTKLEIDKAEIDAQIEKAEAQGKEEDFIKKLEDVKKEPDRKKRLELLSQLLD